MLSSLRNMFRVADLRNKILFTLAIIALYRLGSYVPAPGIDLDAIDLFYPYDGFTIIALM